MCEIHSYLKVCSDSKIWREGSSVFRPEATPCSVEGVYGVLVVGLRLSQRVHHCNVGSIDFDNKQYPMESVDIHI